MKLIFLIFLASNFSCGSKNPRQTTVPPFNAKKVCSKTSLAYLETEAPKKRKNYQQSDIRPYMLPIEPLVKNCYQTEVNRTSFANHFNLCLVVGVDKVGKKEFFEFSTTEISMAAPLQECLKEIEAIVNFDELKDLVIVQPFRLYPKEN